MLGFTIRNLKKISVSVGFVASLFFAPIVFAQITPVGPFTGDALEDFESFGTGAAPVSITVFGGMATHNQLSGSTPWIWSTDGWGLGDNGSAQAFDGNQGFGINSFATGEFVFNSPITLFGAYFGTALFFIVLTLFLVIKRRRRRKT